MMVILNRISRWLQTHKVTLLVWAALTALNALLYAPMLNGYFYYDDFQFLGMAQRAPDWLSAAQAEMAAGYAVRPVLDLILWLRFNQFGWNPTPYFAINILQNCLNTILVYLLAQQLFGSRRISTAAAVMFTVAFPPIQVVTWITGALISLVSTFYLLTTICFIQFLASKRRIWYGLSVLGFVLAIFSQEYAVTLMPMLVLVSLALYREVQISIKRLVLWLLPFALILIPYLWIELSFLRGGTSEGVAGGGFELGWHIFPNILNLVHLILPDLHYPRLSEFLSAAFPLGLTVLQVLDPILKGVWVLASLALLIFGSNRVRLLTLWPYVVFSPFTLWLSQDFVHSSRYLYLPMFAFSILVALGFSSAARWTARRKPALKNLAFWGLVGLWVIYNGAPVMIFQSQEVSKGTVRRTIVQTVLEKSPNLPTNAQLFIGVPHKNYRDLQFGIPEIYPGKISVITIPPGEWPTAPAPNTLFFHFENNQLLEGKGN